VSDDSSEPASDKRRARQRRHKPPHSKALAGIWRLLVGPPLRSREGSKQHISSVEGLPALSLDALTSVAYGPEAIVVVLAAAGAGALHLVLAETLAIVGLLTILIFSYRQVIDAYPDGGGAYAVSRANLPKGWSDLAAASLIVDYTLTVSVSIAAGVGALTSAFGSLSSLTVPLCLGILAVITVLNLRGLGESARAFLLPTAVFIVGLLAVIVVGLIHPLAATVPQPGRLLTPSHALEAVGILLVLKAFAAGCTALTGVEAIANGVPLFKEPRQQTAKRTEMLLGVLLGLMLLGLAVLAVRFHIQPRSGQTVLSQIMGAAVGRHFAYYVVSLTITLVLALAANTSFGGLPILGSVVAGDNRLPHVFALRGDRLVFANGIWALSIMSGALLVALRGNTEALLPMFAIGVFTGFTLAQAGLVIHWRRARPARWRRRATINGVGACVTGVATLILLVTKFVEGAWVVVVAVPLFILLFRRIHAYYERVAGALGFGILPPKPAARRTTVVVPVTQVSTLTERALAEALSIGEEVIAVTVRFEGQGAPPGGDPGPEAGDDETSPATTPTPAGHQTDIAAEWERWDPGIELRVLHTDYTSVTEPIVAFVDELREDRDDQIVVLIPVIIPAKFRYRALHNQVDLVLSAALRGRDDIVVARVPMELDAGHEP
jgi:amino acid transporter